MRFSGGLRVSRPFDIVFADPPYDRQGTRRWAMSLLEELTAAEVVSDTGFFVMEQGRDEAEAIHPAWRLVATKAYGGTRLTIYRKGAIS